MKDRYIIRFDEGTERHKMCRLRPGENSDVVSVSEGAVVHLRENKCFILISGLRLYASDDTRNYPMIVKYDSLTPERMQDIVGTLIAWLISQSQHQVQSVEVRDSLKGLGAGGRVLMTAGMPAWKREDGAT